MSNSNVSTKQNRPFPEQGLVSLLEASEFLGVSLSALRKAQTRNAIKAPIKVGSSSRWEAAYIRELAETGINIPSTAEWKATQAKLKAA